jgi:hypothetical protein
LLRVFCAEKKLEILVEISTEHNRGLIIKHLESLVKSPCTLLAKKAIASIGDISFRAKKMCSGVLVKILKSNQPGDPLLIESVKAISKYLESSTIPEPQS